MVFFLMARTSSGVPHRTKTAKRWMDGWMHRQMCRYMDGWMHACIGTWMDGWMDG